MFAFFTLKAWPIGCTNASGCAHDDAGPGGKAVLARSVDGRGRFDQITFFSSTKFLFPAPAVANGSQFPGLPTDLSAQRVAFVFGTGRENNGAWAPDPWNRSYPYLAVTSLADVAARNGRVYSHPVSDTDVGSARPLRGEAIGARVADKWVVAQDNRILVIRDDGLVFAHDVGDPLGKPYAIPPRAGATPAPLVAANPGDKWVLVHRDRLLVVTEDGRVFAHRVTGDVEAAFQLGGPPNQPTPIVATNPEDKWVLVVGDRILVITKNGKVFAHRITDKTIHPTVELAVPEGGVAGSPRDRWVLGMGNKIVVITGNGDVVTHVVRDTIVEGHRALTSTQRVAANPEDRWVLAVGTPGGRFPSRLIVIPYYPARWRYFAGLQASGLPNWQTEERLARPLAPFGDFDLPGNSMQEFHKCLGYFSVRFVEPAQKWVMLYTCDRPRSGPRGVYMRTARMPWGPWSPPTLIFDPFQAPPQGGYCNFMHSTGQCRSGTNRFEEEKRKPDPTSATAVREPGGEYAPFLLPSRYQKYRQGAQTTLYYLMSTWNPYQVVLMKALVDLGP
jgi:hypothetical protein